MQGTQIPLNFPFRPASGRDDFLVTDSNSDAVAWIDLWPDWPSRTLLLIGPAGSGKSHLAQVWQTRSGADILDPDRLDTAGIEELTATAAEPLILEDADKIISTGNREKTLFHLYNLVQEKGGSLLITARVAPNGWGLRLADLLSRLGTVPVARIREPDDTLFAALVIKLFSDRQLAVTPDVVQYIVDRLERSFDAAGRFVAKLDDSALAGKRKITLALIREVLKEQGE